MSLKHKFSSKPNPRYNEQKLKKLLAVETKLDRDKKDISRNDAENSSYLEVVKDTIDRKLRECRITIKNLEKEPKVLQEVHITSDKEWVMYPEHIGDECGRTRYSEPKKFKVDVVVPYSRFIQKKVNGQYLFDEEGQPIMEEANVKGAIRAAGDNALAELKDYRKKSREVQFIEKTFNIPNFPHKPKYKVYAGNGYGGPAATYKFVDAWSGYNGVEFTKPEQKDNYFIHMEGGTFLKLQEVSRTRKVFEKKSPRTNEHHVGIEIEFISKLDKLELATALCKENVQDFVFLTDDGSIRYCDSQGNPVEDPVDEYCHKHELTMVAPEAIIHAVIRLS